MVEQVKQQQQACDANPACAQQASDLRGPCSASAELLERDPLHAVSRVTTIGTGGQGPSVTSSASSATARSGRRSRARSTTAASSRARKRSSSPTRDGQLLLRQPGMPGAAPPAERLVALAQRRQK